MRYETATYEPRSAMPREVAVSILTGGSKLTARVRKRCFAALEQVTPSRHPILLAFRSDDGFSPVSPRKLAILDFESGEMLTKQKYRQHLVRVWDTAVVPKPFKQKVAGRMRSVAFARLWRLLRRLDRRSRTTHHAMIRAGSLVTAGLRDELLARLQVQLDKLNEVRQVVENEILLRNRRKVNNE